MQKSEKLESTKQEHRILKKLYVVLKHALPFQVLLAFHSLKQINNKTVHSETKQLLLTRTEKQLTYQ